MGVMWCAWWKRKSILLDQNEIALQTKVAAVRKTLGITCRNGCVFHYLCIINQSREGTYVCEYLHAYEYADMHA